MTTHLIQLSGPAVHRDGISGPLLGSLLSTITEGCREGVRLRVEGRSVAKGTRPDWLDKACDYTYPSSGLDSATPEAGASLTLKAPPLAQAVPERFSQPYLEGFLDVSRSCVSLWQDSLADAVQGKADSDLYDDGFLKDMERRFQGLFRQGLDGITLSNGTPSAPALRVKPEDVQRLHRLRAETPRGYMVRLAGKLDAIRHSDRMFWLILGGAGEPIKGVADDVLLNRLPGLFGKDVVITGRAIFRPSGGLLRINTEHMEPARPQDLNIFSKRPEPRRKALDRRAYRVPQGPRSGVGAIFGQWPGDESDEEFARLIEELS